MSSWYLIHTKIRREQEALRNLERQGYEVFLPMMTTRKLRRGLVDVAREPLFPRYLFIRLDTGLEGRGWGPVRSTVGVSRLVTFGQVPARVDDALIEQLRSRSEAEVEDRLGFDQGEPVLLADGPFAGLEAIFQAPTADGRVIVLLTLLSRQVRTSVPIQNVRRQN